MTYSFSPSCPDFSLECLAVDDQVLLLPGLSSTSNQVQRRAATMEEVGVDQQAGRTCQRQQDQSILEDPGLASASLRLPPRASNEWYSLAAAGEEWCSAGRRRPGDGWPGSCTARCRLETIAVRSILYGVLGMLPAAVVQQVGGRPSGVVGLLDQLSPVDAEPLAERVTAPSLVTFGEPDVANRRPSAALARSLPLGDLRVLPGAGAGSRLRLRISLRSCLSTSCPGRRSEVFHRVGGCDPSC